MEQKVEEVKKDDLMDKIMAGLDELEGAFIKLRKQNMKQWNKGFYAGYGSAVTGVILGLIAAKYIVK